MQIKKSLVFRQRIKNNIISFQRFSGLLPTEVEEGADRDVRLGIAAAEVDATREHVDVEPADGGTIEMLERNDDNNYDQQAVQSGTMPQALTPAQPQGSIGRSHP